MRLRLSLSMVGFAVLACGAPTPPLRGAPPQVVVSASDASPSVADAQPPERTFDPIRPAKSYLEPADTAFPRRARVAFFGALYATDPSAAAAPATSTTGSGEAAQPLAAPGERQEAAPYTDVVVVEERPQAVRVRIDNGEVRLVVYLRDADFHAVVRRPTRASLGVYATPDDSTRDGVWVQPGLVVSPGAGMLRGVPVDDPLFVGDAWVERAAVDRVYEIAPEPPAPHDLALASGTVVQTNAGAPILTIPSDAHPAVVVLAVAGARSRVRYLSDMLRVEGWVPTSALEEEAGGLGLWGTGTGGWGTSGATRHLHAGDELRTDPGSELIGRVIGERVLARDHGGFEGGRKVGVYLGGWPFAPLWISADDLAFGEKWEDVYRERVKLEPLPGAAPLPAAVSRLVHASAKCWDDALAMGTRVAFDLRLQWKSGTQIDVPKPAGLDDRLHACLERAFARVVTPKPPALPLDFMLHLAPTPLPERP